MTATKPRITFVDVLRLTALAQMINGHTLDTVLLPAYRGGPVFDQYNYVRGLVSVAFMMAAGLAYHLTTVARFEKHRANPAAQRKRLRRGVSLLVIGYLLRFRCGMFGETDWGREALHAVFHVDVLHCIGFSLLVMEGLVRTLRSAREVSIVGGVLALLFVALAPLGARIPITPDNAWIVNWLSHEDGSLFPVLPWAGYVIGGMALGAIVLPRGIETPRDLPPKRLLLAGAITWVIGRVVGAQPLTLVAEGTRWASRPAFFIQKLAVVLLVVGVLAFALSRVSRLPRWTTTLASETLAVYVFHLLVLYRFSWSPSRTIGRTLELGPALGVSAAMIVVCVSAGLGWHYWKELYAWLVAKLRERLAARRPAH